MKQLPSWILIGSLALGAEACSSQPDSETGPPSNDVGGGGGGGLAGSGGASGGAGSGGAAGVNAAGQAGSAGTSLGGAAGSAGSSAGGGFGGGAGSGGDSAGSAGAAGTPGTGKLMLTVDGIQMGDRLCFKPEASNSGGNHSPKIDWTGIPPGTKSLALTMYDQTNTTPHRIVCNMSPSLMGQPADIKTTVPDGAQVSTGHSKPGNPWYGPGAGGNAHSYEIAIWALSTPELEGGCSLSGAEPTRAVYKKLKSAPSTLVLASASQVLWGNVDGKCTP